MQLPSSETNDEADSFYSNLIHPCTRISGQPLTLCADPLELQRPIWPIRKSEFCWRRKKYTYAMVMTGDK
jgi:hypothetical protein